MNDTAVQIRDLRFTWPGLNTPTLAIDDWSLLRGERVFLQGQSGSGKSTLLALICGILSPQAGQLDVLGQALSTLSARARDRFRADYLGLIFQQFNLIPYLNSVENVNLPSQLSRARRQRAEVAAPSLLEQLGLPAALHQRSVLTLSIGQQQRVAAARALMGAPPLIIADEPTSALDTQHREEFIQLLFKACQTHGCSLLFVSHDQQLAPLFDRSVCLSDINRASAHAV